METEVKPVILHIDDDESNRYAVRRILERAGYDIIDAEDGESGLELALQMPDLIILDIRLPDIDGFTVCRKIKADPILSSIPVLQTSATFTSSESKVEGLESGADGYLAQPIESAVLVATVRSLFRIKNAEKIANEAIRSREETLAIVSHDLRNPLSAIMLQVKMLTKLTEKGDEIKELPEKLSRIMASCNRMNRLIQDLLDVSNIEGGKFSLNKQNFSAVGFIDEIVSHFDDLAKNQDIGIEKKINTKDFQISADKDRVTQAIGNIVANSLKFTPGQGKVTICLDANDRESIIGISDTGSGIEAESLPHIFDRYWQGHKLKNAGVGLGLSIVKGIIEAHGGRVWAESTEGKGSTFYLTLPKSSTR